MRFNQFKQSFKEDPKLNVKKSYDSFIENINSNHKSDGLYTDRLMNLNISPL